MINSDLISRSALMQYINDNHLYAGLPMAAHICTMELLTYAPAVDAVEVVHGQFILDSGKDVIRCSVCGFESPSTIPYIYDGEKWVPFYERKYCGNCGAKMDGGKLDE